jgi:hypothetical protein
MSDTKIDWNDPTLFATDDAALDWDALVKSTAAAVKTADKAEQTKLFKASLTTFYGYEVLHVLGDGDDQTGRNAYAKQIGVTGAYVTKCRRLGFALVSGVTYGDDAWRSLSRHVNNAKVSAILDARDEDGALLPLDKAALTDTLTALDKAAESSGAKGGKAGKGPKDPEDKAADPVAVSALDAAKSAMDTLRKVRMLLSPTEARGFVNGLEGVLAEYRERAAETEAPAEETEAPAESA